MGDFITLNTEQGAPARAYLSLPPTGNGPGVLLMHAWWGLNDFQVELAGRLSEAGFVVLAPDLYNGRVASTIPEAEELGSALDSNGDYGLQAESAALDYILKHPAIEGSGIGAVAFSLGAAYGTWLSTLRSELKAIVLFYGDAYGGPAQSEPFPARTGANYLGHFAEEDPYVSADETRHLEAGLRAADKEANFYFYPGTGHWFFESDRPDAFNPEAARLAWERTVEFLHRQLG